VAYFGYQYLVSSGLWSQWFGGAAATPGGLTAQQIAAGIQNGQFVQAGTDAAGNIIVHQLSTGAYYAVNPTTGAVAAASGPGSGGTVGTQPTATVPITQPNPVALPPATSTLATQLQTMANQYMANMQAAGTPVAGLNIDQWLFYYDQIRGASLFGTAQGESLIQAAGVTDATRSTIIPLATFMAALGSVGLSGIVRVPNQGPITVPLPTSQSFNRGYGGYPGRREMRKGYLN
jgi:hypothetical protein